ncbi:MAG: hypothetical protein EA349_01840 [Halomonadaceae bacterium]|nr:MAG: hypothetical protein EA349_01840 [Halomonadaceae bacterium]
MAQATVADALREFMTFMDILDDAYWEAARIEHKDSLYDIISIFTKEVSELNKLSVQDHHYPYEIISEGLQRVVPRLERINEEQLVIIPRTRTGHDFRETLSMVLNILDEQLELGSL